MVSKEKRLVKLLSKTFEPKQQIATDMFLPNNSGLAGYQGDANFNSITIKNDIVHSGDSNSILRLTTNDQWNFITGGSSRLTINNNGATVSNGAFSGWGIVPIGTIVAFLKSFTNTPTMPDGWAECNGQVLSDADSVYDGLALPNLNGSLGGTDRFLRGDSSSGTTGGSANTTLATTNLPSHSHGVTDAGHTHTINESAHTHTIIDPTHTHGIGDPTHRHDISKASGSGAVSTVLSSVSPLANSAIYVQTEYASTGITVSGASTGITVSGAVTGITTASATTGITIDNTGSGTSFTNEPPYYTVVWIMRIK